MKTKSEGQIISTLLSRAVKLWLKTQVESMTGLHLEIQASNHEILQGKISNVNVSCDQAIYQGLHLGSAQLTAKTIRTNLRQVLRGKPLQLLDRIEVQLSVTLLESQLQASLKSDLLQQGLRELLAKIFPDDSFIQINNTLHWENLSIQGKQVILEGKMDNQLLILRLGLSLTDSQSLYLSPLIVERGSDTPLSLNLDIDLGSDVILERLQLLEGEIQVSGQLFINP